MKTYKQIVQKKKIETAKYCDICNLEEHEWEIEYKADICVWMNKYDYEGYFDKTYEYDICPQCFEKKLIPFIEENKYDN